jgi:hypothetical protein
MRAQKVRAAPLVCLEQAAMATTVLPQAPARPALPSPMLQVDRVVPVSTDLI